jgi:hypothetical protein
MSDAMVLRQIDIGRPRRVTFRAGSDVPFFDLGVRAPGALSLVRARSGGVRPARADRRTAWCGRGDAVGYLWVAMCRVG